MRPYPQVDITCPVCGHMLGSLSGLRGHLKSDHTSLGVRGRSELATIARREAGWWGVRN